MSTPCTAQSPLQPAIAANYHRVCGQDLSTLTVMCSLDEGHVERHDGPVGDIGWLSWDDSAAPVRGR